jgi:predicted porin
MNKKLLTLAVAAALAAPVIAPSTASAEAIVYGKLNVSVDYVSMDNIVASPVYNDTASVDYAGDDVFVAPDGSLSDIVVPTGTVLTENEALALRGFQRVAPGQRFAGQDYKGWSLNRGMALGSAGVQDRNSRVGVKGSEDLGNGLKAIYQIEFEVDITSEHDSAYNLTNNDRGTVAMRNSFLGLAGDWGTFLVGRHDTPLKVATGKLDQFGDTIADYNTTIGFQDIRADNTIAYISPNFSGFQLAAALVPAGGDTAGYGRNWEADQINSAYSLAGIYSNGPFFASVAYESLSQELFMNTSTSLNGCFANGFTTADGSYSEYSCDRVEDDQGTWVVGLGILDWNGFTLSGVYEEQDLATTANWAFGTGVYAQDTFNMPSGPDKKKMWQIQAGYAFGNVQLKGMYGQANYDGNYNLGDLSGMTAANQAVLRGMANDYYDGGNESWALGVDYNFSKRTKAYALYTETTTDTGSMPILVNASGNYDAFGSDPQWSGFSLGMMHSF